MGLLINNDHINAASIVYGAVIAFPVPNTYVEDHQNGACSISITQKIEMVSEDLPKHLLQPPKDSETWERRYISSYALFTFKETLKLMPGFHVVGQTSDDKYYEVAICGSCIQYLTKISFPLVRSWETNPQYDVSQPITPEIELYECRAARNAQLRFIQDAVDGVSKGHGRGLEEYYQKYTVDPRVSSVIKWASMKRKILGLSTEVIRRFLQHCVYIIAHSLKDLEADSQLKVLKRDEKQWIRFFQDLVEERTQGPAFDPLAEVQLVLLLQEVLNSASGQIGKPPTLFDTIFSPMDNLKMFSALLDFVTEPEPVPFGSKEEELTQILRQCNLFQGNDELDVTALREQICKYVPIGTECSNISFCS